MSRANQTQVIALSGTASAAFRIDNSVEDLAVLLPVLTSCSMFIQLSPDNTAGNFRRASDVNGAISLPAAAGSISMVINREAVGGATFMKLESSVAQAAVRSLTLMCRL